MRTLFFDCKMGAAGDMLSAALLELLNDKEEIIKEINNLNIPKVSIQAFPSSKCGIIGTHVEVLIDGVTEDEDLHKHSHHHDDNHSHNHDHSHSHDHTHSTLASIKHLVYDHLELPQKVKEDVISIYTLIAEAEAKVHNSTIENIHFHEVGTMDAVADIVTVCLLINKLNPDRIVVSPINVGSGFVRCAHGVLPVPAPATAAILKGVPIYSGNIKSELCTPTGAAILKHFADSFEDLPVIKIEAIGYGMGKKDFEVANCVRAILGETEDKGDEVIELIVNIDDMTAEAIGFATNVLLDNGALDVYTSAIGMKKNRPGTMLSVLCKPEDKEKMVKLLFKHTTSLGIRENTFKRYTLKRNTEEEETVLGTVKKKISSGYDTKKTKYEFEDLAKLAKAHNKSLNEILDLLNKK